jgi:hypothetical protein
MEEFKEYTSSIGMTIKSEGSNPHDKELQAGSLVTCVQFKGKRRGSIVCAGKIERIRRNGTFDVVYEGGLKEIGVDRSAIVCKTPVHKPHSIKEVGVEKPTPKSSTSIKLSRCVVWKVLDEARTTAKAHAAEEEQLLLSDALHQIRGQISKQEKRKKGGHLKGEAGMRAVNSLLEIRGRSELSGQLVGGMGGVQGVGHARKKTALTDEENPDFSLIAVSIFFSTHIVSYTTLFQSQS